MGTCLAVLWLRLCASSAGSPGLIPGLGTNIPPATGTQLKKGEGGARGDQTKGLWGR